MNATISSIVIRNAIEYVYKARAANRSKRPDKEVCYSIGAHLMIAIAIEGIGNEIGEAAFGKDKWNRLERRRTVYKWRLLSEINKNKPFSLNKEPLLTVDYINSVRNRIAHPKVVDLGDEIIIRSKNRVLRRNPQPNYILKEGDTLFVGVTKLLTEFNYRTSFDAIRKSISAIRVLREHITVTGLDWIDDMEKKFLRRTSPKRK